GRERAAAERELQVERAEQEQPEHEAAVGEEEQQTAADRAVAEALDAQQRLCRAALADRERGETGDAGAADAEGPAGEPAGVVGLGDRVDDRRDAARAQDGAAEVETAPARLPG